MKTLIAIVLLSLIALAVYGADAPTPTRPHVVTLGYILYSQKIGARSGGAMNPIRVKGVSMFKSIEACYMWTTGKVEYPDASGYVNIYFCRPLTRVVWPRGTRFL